MLRYSTHPNHPNHPPMVVYKKILNFNKKIIIFSLPNVGFMTQIADANDNVIPFANNTKILTIMLPVPPCFHYWRLGLNR